MTTQALNTQITTYIEDLAALTDTARFSEAMQAYLDTCARFHRYSWLNTLLIMWGRPGATQVAGYNRWLQLKRYVRKGERGIPILAPMFIRQDKADPQSDTILRFKVAHVFDISQTEGEPLPEAPDWKSLEQSQGLTERLMAYAASQGIAVTVEALSGNKQGVSMGGSIVLSPEAGTKTLIHELAHELLHHGEQRPSREVMETQAEAIAYVVARHFGLGDLNSPNYLALWDANTTVIRTHMERISTCARQIITALEGDDVSATPEIQS
jgi:hypothetical protein